MTGNYKLYKLLRTFRSGLIHLTFLIIAGCSTDPFEVDLSNTPPVPEVRRFDEAFFSVEPEDFRTRFEELRTTYPPFFQQGDADFWYRQRTDSILNDLHRQVEKGWLRPEEDLSRLRSGLRHYAHYYPEAPAVRTYTYISDLDYDYPVIFADSLLFLALDQFTGPESPHFNQLPLYISEDKTFPLLPVWALENMAERFVTPPAGNTLLDAMLYEGRKLAWMKFMLPEMPEHMLLKYTPEQWEFCGANEGRMWRYLVEQKLLFDPGDQPKQRFIHLAPFTKFYSEIDRETPGQVGRWIGYRIIRAWLDSQPKPLHPNLLRENEAQKILRNSQYKPS